MNNVFVEGLPLTDKGVSPSRVRVQRVHAATAITLRQDESNRQVPDVGRVILDPSYLARSVYLELRVEAWDFVDSGFKPANERPVIKGRCI